MYTKFMPNILMMQINTMPPDGGMLYTETNLDRFFPEPLNAITSLLFLLLAGYWTYRLAGKGKTHTFLSFAVALLYIGGIGGTIYHGLRQWSIFIMMDWLPIMLLCVAAGVYFLSRIVRWYFAVSVILLYAAFQFFLRQKFAQGNDIQLFININYAVLASIVLFPVLGFLVKTKFRHARWVSFALVAFVFALTFRVTDGWGWVSFGTHFLWHVFGAVAAFCMFNYIYLINKDKQAVAELEK